jgi:lactate dehydrogenase-like 2-hydroxyacid dehydrogenase
MGGLIERSKGHLEYDVFEDEIAPINHALVNLTRSATNLTYAGAYDLSLQQMYQLSNFLLWAQSKPQNANI